MLTLSTTQFSYDATSRSFGGDARALGISDYPISFELVSARTGQAVEMLRSVVDTGRLTGDWERVVYVPVPARLRKKFRLVLNRYTHGQ